jgi:ATP-dependent helicase/nuclease subunit A
MNILEKNLLILASAGSGKTFQLANRIIGLVAMGVAPDKIVALTFTRKAAGEFADALLTKLASAAENPSAATRLREDLGMPDADFAEPLKRVVRALPRLTLGTMDGFFAKVVRGFQYELGLTGGPFQMVEGPQADALIDGVLNSILGNVTESSHQHGFVHAFRRATIGKENHSVTSALRRFVSNWQTLFQESSALEWGPSHLFTHHPDDWEKSKAGLAASAMRGLDDLNYTHAKQKGALEIAIGKLESHVIGSGSLGKGPTLLDNILHAASIPGDSLTVKSQKDFTISGTTAQALRNMAELAAACELAAAILRTRALREVVSLFDESCEIQLRRNGRLGFNDIKMLMGRWATNENARLRREAVDFRLDARIDHWLLDEFQDTSRADWYGLRPLVDEAVSDPDSSVFIVGDRKQAIYAWRGGDVTLFDEITTRYGNGFKTEPMDVSWRSCPEVLSLVNRICGDLPTMRGLFGDAAARWTWHQHASAPPLMDPAKQGESRVEIVGTWDERLDRLPALLTEIGVGKRAITCGILLRGNDKASQVAERLRAEGLDVVEEGRRKPASDNPPGLALLHLFKWLANPSDSYSREVIAMSPVASPLHADHGASWSDIWQNLTREISQRGFERSISRLLASIQPGCSDYGRRRIAELLSALADLDRMGETSTAIAADWLERLEISQSPGEAAVQVMTIHKSKGLGFDVVILPDIPDDSTPQSQHFDISNGETWLTETPPKWARNLIPELAEAELKWGEKQRYENFCTLYVAITRAKYGLYILLEPPAKFASPNKPSLANWVACSVDSDSSPGTVFQTGNPAWMDSAPSLMKSPADAAIPLPST